MCVCVRVLWRAKYLLTLLMRLHKKVCLAVNISRGGPDESWHRYSGVKLSPYHISHCSPLFSHDEMEQIVRLKKNIRYISSAVESNLYPVINFHSS